MRPANAGEHVIQVKATTEYELSCSCGWREVTNDLFATEALKEDHLAQVRRNTERRKEP